VGLKGEIMVAQEFRIIGLYLYNRVDYNKFSELLGDYEEPYVREKWLSFTSNPLSFCLNNIEFLENVIKDIKESNYKG
jgi:hypothetical protein